MSVSWSSRPVGDAIVRTGAGLHSSCIREGGLIAGAGGGRGVLTYRGHDYPFRVSGFSFGVTHWRIGDAADGTGFGAA